MDSKVKEIFIKHFKSEENLFNYKFVCPPRLIVNWSGGAKNSARALGKNAWMPQRLMCLKTHIMKFIYYNMRFYSLLSQRVICVYEFIIYLSKHPKQCKQCLLILDKFYDEIDTFVAPNLVKDEVLNIVKMPDKAQSMMEYNPKMFKKWVLNIQPNWRDKNILLRLSYSNYDIFRFLIDNDFRVTKQYCTSKTRNTFALKDITCENLIIDLGSYNQNANRPDLLYYRNINKYFGKKDIVNRPFDNYKLDLKKYDITELRLIELLVVHDQKSKLLEKILDDNVFKKPIRIKRLSIYNGPVYQRNNICLLFKKQININSDEILFNALTRNIKIAKEIIPFVNPNIKQKNGKWLIFCIIDLEDFELFKEFLKLKPDLTVTWKNQNIDEYLQAELQRKSPLFECYTYLQNYTVPC